MKSSFCGRIGSGVDGPIHSRPAVSGVATFDDVVITFEARCSCGWLSGRLRYSREEAEKDLKHHYAEKPLELK